MLIFSDQIIFISGFVCLVAGLVSAGCLLRQGWLVAALGLLAISLGVPGFISWCAGIGAAASAVVFVVWQRKDIGHTL